MALFKIPERNTKKNDVAVARKSNAKKYAAPEVSIKGSGGLVDKIATIKATLERYLGKYKDEYIILNTKQALGLYIDTIIQDTKVVAIDTETDGLDPMLNHIAGISIYTPGNKPAYIPINHISYITNAIASNQINVKDVEELFTEMFEYGGIEVIMFDADFDIRVLRNQAGIKNVRCDWDCYLAARLLNENEPSNALKKLHQKYVLEDKEDEFRFGELFKGIPFTMIPVSVGYLYAAHDAIITYELYQFQKQYLDINSDREDLRNVAWVFHNIEMPCVGVVAEMEDTGVLLNQEYSNELSIKYNAMLDEVFEAYKNDLSVFNRKIEDYKVQNPTAKIENPVNISSPTQIAILLYDILQIGEVDKKMPRGTGEPVLQKLKSTTKDENIKRLCEDILKYREISKLISTYIDKLPECVNPNDGRIHCRFNQYGADTGRFSSSDPNLQNIPSHNKDIRKMFVASPGYVLMSSDYSQQEPKVMTQMCQDPKMIQAYKDGKDLYAEIAALSFNTDYENCLEFRPDGTTNPDGKNRRSQAKSILLGVLYGRGVPSIAEQLGTSTEKAQAIKDSVFKGFPAIPKFEQDSLEMAYELGYVTTLWGRKRRLPDLQLEEYEFKWKDGAPPTDDVLDFDDEEDNQEVPDELVNKYLRKLRQARFGQKRKIFEEANKEGIWIIDNGGKIADAQRQCVNARIQGSAADMSKLAMILVGNDKRLKELGFRLLIPVHDELIAECPEENVKECSQRFAQLMSEAAKSRLEIPIKCDVSITKQWYGEELRNIT